MVWNKIFIITHVFPLECTIGENSCWYGFLQSVCIANPDGRVLLCRVTGTQMSSTKTFSSVLWQKVGISCFSSICFNLETCPQDFLVSYAFWKCSLEQRWAIIELQLLFLHLFTFCDLLHLIMLSGGYFPLHHFDIVRIATSGTIASFSSAFDSLNLVNLLQVHTWKEDVKPCFSDCRNRKM